MALMLLMSYAFASSQNVITIDPVKITSGAGVVMPVNFNNAEPFQSLVYDIQLPAGVTIDGELALVESRFAYADEYTQRIERNPNGLGENVWRIGLFPQTSKTEIPAGEGVFMNIGLAITDEALLAGGKFTLAITAPKTPGVTGSEFTISIEVPTEAKATITGPEEIAINDENPVKVPIYMDNNLAVNALKFDVNLPKGLELEKNERGRYVFNYSNRWIAGSSINVTDREGGVRIIISNTSSNVIAEAGEGELFSFNIIDNEEHQEYSEIEVKVINASMKWNGKDVDVYSPDFTIAVTNSTVYPKISDLTALVDLPDNTIVDLATDLTVVIANETLNLVWDGKSFMGLKANQAFNKGDIIEAGWRGLYAEHCLTAAGNLSVKGTASVLPEPTPVQPKDLMYPQPDWQYETLVEINLARDLAQFGVGEAYAQFYGPDGLESIAIQLFDLYGIAPLNSAMYSFTGFWMTTNLGGEDSQVFVPVEYTKLPEKIDSLIALTDLPDNTEVVITADMTVAYANEVINLIYDGSSYVGLVANQTLEAGDIIKAGWTAVYADKKLQAAGTLTIDGKGKIPQPKEITPEMLMYPQPNWDYQVLTPILLSADMAQGGMGEAYAQFESEEGPENIPVQVLDVLGVGPVEKGRYSIRGFWMEYNLGSEYTTVFVPIEFTPYYEKIENLSSLVDFPDNTTVEIAADMTVVYANEALNLIYDGVSYMGLVANQALEEGDIIKAGWLAVYADKKLQAAGALTIDGKAEVLPEPKEIEAEMLMYPQPNWGYQVLLNINAPDGMGEGVRAVYAQFVDPEEGEVDIPIQLNNFYNLPEVKAGRYNIRGFWMPLNVGEEYMETFVPIELVEQYEKIEDLSALVDFPDNTTVEIAADMTVVYANEALNLIYDGVSYMGLVANQALEEGDIIKAGWLAVYADKKLQAAGALTIDGKAEVLPEPKEIEAEMLMYPQPNWGYQVLLNINAPDGMGEGVRAVYAQFVDPEEGEVDIPIQLNNFYNLPEVKAGRYNIRGFWMPLNVGEEYMETFVPIELVEQYEKIEDLSALVDFPDNTTVEIAADMTVVYANEVINLIYDGVSYMGLVANQALEEGDIIKGGWLAVYADKKLQAAGALTIDGKAEVLPEPKEIEAEMLMYPQPNWDYQVLLNINAADGMDEGVKTVYAQFVDPEEGRVDIPIQLYNYLGLDAVDPGYYNIRGFWMPLNLGEEYMETFVPIELTQAKAVIDNLNALADVPEGEEFIYAGDLTVAYVTNSGFIGVYDGTTFGMLCDDPTAFEAGDIIKGGWNATIYSDMLFILDDFEISGQAEVLPSPVEVAAEDVEQSQYQWNWISINSVIVPETYYQDARVYASYTVQQGDEEWTENSWFCMIDYFAVTETGMFEPGVYNVTGTWLNDYEYGWVLLPTSVEDVTPTIDSFNAIADIPYGVPVIVGMDLSVSTQTDDFFEVFDSYMFGAIGTYDIMDEIAFEFNDGDVIAKGWRAMINNNMILPLYHDLASVETTTPQPAVEIEATEVETSKYPFNYVTIMNVTVDEPIAEFDFTELTATAIVEGEAVTASFILDNFYGIEIPAGKLDITGVWYKMDIMFGDEGHDAPQYKLYPLAVRDTEYTGLNDVSVDNGEVEYFNINGMKIDQPKSGSIVIRVVNGKAEKIAIK